MSDTSLNKNVTNILSMFPNVPRELIISDLEMTHSFETTVNRILDEELVPKMNDYDDELPDLDNMINVTSKVIGVADSTPTKINSMPKKKFSFKKTENCSSKVHDISSDSSESDCDSNQPKHVAVSAQSRVFYSGESQSDRGNNRSSIPSACVPGTSLSTNRTGAIVNSPDSISDLNSMARQTSITQAKNSPLKAPRKKRSVEEIQQSKTQALALKDQAKQKREQKKRELEFEKQKRRALLDARRHAKPGECLKHMTAVISPGTLTEKSGTHILDTLQTNNIKYDIQQQVHNNIITFWREVTEVIETGDMKLETVTEEKVENTILLLLPVLQFVNLVYNYKQKQLGLGCLEDLHDHIVNIKNSLEGRDVTVLIQGLEKYFRDLKTKENRAFKKQVQSVDGEVMENQKRRKKADTDVIISRMDVEEALIHLQLNDGCNIRFAEQEQDIGKLVLNYAKAVAETPFKRDRLETGFTFHLESSGSVHVDKEGVGLARVWRQQLQQFSMVTAEVSNAIIAVYPSPVSLLKAYQQCESRSKAEKLLENIEVRRGAGVMATTRRVGKELSRRLYEFFTTADSDFVIM